MKCYRCEKDMADDMFVYEVKGLGGYYCLACAKKMNEIVGLGYKRISNISYYID